MIVKHEDNDKVFRVLCDCYVAHKFPVVEGDLLQVVRFEPRKNKLVFRHNQDKSYTEINDTAYFELALRRKWVKEFDPDKSVITAKLEQFKSLAIRVRDFINA